MPATPKDWERAAPAEVGLSPAGLDAVDTIVRGKVDDGTLAGAATLIARHGKVVRTRFFGVGDRKTGLALNDDTIYRIFSMTKPITGLAMGVLADRGLWHPDDPIAKHLPELAGMKVAVTDRKRRIDLVEPEHLPTMRELMTHTAGFVYGGETDEVAKRYKKAKLMHATDANDFVNRLARLPLAFQPGTSWRYGISMDVQGAIIERLTGLGLGAFMRREIFEPLGMHDTAFFVPPQEQSRLAAVYYTGRLLRLHRLKKNPLFPEYDHEPPFALGGAGLTSTLWDYARFCRLLLAGGVTEDGHRLVSEKALEAQMTNQISENLITPGFRAGQMRFRPGFGYGYNGVVVYDPERADLPVGRGTYFWDGAAGTWFWVDPVADLLFVGMIQLASTTAPPMQELTQRAVAAAIGGDA